MSSDLIAVGAPIGVALLDYAAGRPAETAQLVVDLVLVVLTVFGGLTRQAWLTSVGRALLPALVRDPIVRALDARRKGGK